MDNIKDRAVLVRFSDRAWRGGIVDKAIGEKVSKDAGAKTNTGHYWLRLVPKAALKGRTNAGIAARNFHNQNTLPWMEGGVRILPVANFDDYMKGMRKLIDKAAGESKTFLKDYPTWIDEAKRTHGRLFNEENYPSVGDLKNRFEIEVDVMPLPNIADWRVELSADQVKELRKQAEVSMQKVQAEGIQELYGLLREMLEHVQERLDDPEATFRDSLIGNIQAMVVRIAKLNVTGDKQLETIRKETEAKLAGVAPSALRTDPKARKDAAKAARDIMKKMSSFMAPGA